MDCPDTCALEVTVSEGRIQKIGGSREHPITAGYICDKIASFGERVYHESRLLTPLRRTGCKGSLQFEKITWDAAIAEITTRFREISARWGAESILPYHYGGSNGYLTDGFLDELYFARLGASRLARTLCAAPAGEVALGMYGKMPGVAFEDYPHARCILIWGANPRASNIHLVPYLRRARKNGAFIGVVDPRRNFSADEVDLHLPVYPGTDVAVALAMIGRWKQQGILAADFLSQHATGLDTLLQEADQWPVERAAEVARVPADDIRRLADVYAASSPALNRCGWGLERNRNGGQSIAAVLALSAVLGKFGVRGGGYTLSNGGATKFDLKKIFGTYDWNTRELNMTRLGALLAGEADPPVKSLFVYNCNPAVTAPEQGLILEQLAREDLFTVVFDQVMTDTAACADIVLPATTFLEDREVRRGYGAYVIGGSQPAISRRGEARPNQEVFAALGRAMGFEDEAFTWDTETCVRKIAEAIEMRGGTPAAEALAETLLAGKHVQFEFPGATPVQFGTVFPQTPDGKICLAPAALGPQPYRYLPPTSEKYPLALISPATSKMVTSMMGEFNFPELRLTLHPADAAERGVREADIVRVYNDLGEVHCRVTLSDRLRRGVAALPKGAWRKSSLNGRTATALCPADVQVVGGGACFNDARVEVARL